MRVTKILPQTQNLIAKCRKKVEDTNETLLGMLNLPRASLTYIWYLDPLIPPGKISYASPPAAAVPVPGCSLAAIFQPSRRPTVSMHTKNQISISYK